MFKAFRKEDKGFTLVELMVVVLIIGILVAIAVPIFNNASKKAKINSCKANIRTIEGAISQMQASDELDLADIDAMPGGEYLKDAPVCPFKVAYVVTDGKVVVTGHDHK